MTMTRANRIIRAVLADDMRQNNGMCHYCGAQYILLSYWLKHIYEDHPGSIKAQNLDRLVEITKDEIAKENTR